MTRKFIIPATAAIALMAAPSFAQTTDSASDLQGNSPRVTEGGFNNDVASQRTFYQGNPEARYGIGIPEADLNTMSLGEDEFAALAATAGASFETESGERLGMIEEVRYNESGFPELVIELEEDNRFDLEKLVLTVTPDNTTIRDGKIFLSMTVDDLALKAASDGVRDDANAEVTVF
ncbi:MAG: hypothetical protein AAGF60_13095 [Pseudomonadota bacterium]